MGEEVVEEGQKSLEPRAGVRHGQEGEDSGQRKHLCVMFIKYLQHACHQMSLGPCHQVPGSPAHVSVWASLIFTPVTAQPSNLVPLQVQTEKNSVSIKTLVPNLVFTGHFEGRRGKDLILYTLSQTTESIQ